MVFEPRPPTLVFGDHFHSTKDQPLELTREDIAKIYKHIRETVGPRFTTFLGGPPTTTAL